MIKVILGVIVIFFIISCSNVNEHDLLYKAKDADSTVLRYPSPNKLFKRDSLFIGLTVWQFLEKKVGRFDFYKSYNIPFDRIKLYVDTICYSPDSLKLISFVFTHTPDFEHIERNDYYYGGYSIIGYRENKHKPWKLYDFLPMSADGADTYYQVKNSFWHYYFGGIKHASDYFWDSSKKEKASVKFKYSLDEPLFWTKNIVWKKGSQYPGLYMFETKPGAMPSDTNARIDLPKLEYPDSLLEKYYSGEGVR